MGDNVLSVSCVLDYYTLRVGGLTFAGVIVFLSVILLAGEVWAMLSVCLCERESVCAF